ncbi:unnamed protein product, partial [Trichobilharzia regenti]
MYTHHPCMRQLICYLTDKPFISSTSNLQRLCLPSTDSSVSTVCDSPHCLDLRLTSVHLVDSHYCSDAGKFISCVLTSLSSMLQLSMPHVNILSKADLIEQYGELDFNLDFFTEVLDLKYLIDRLHKTNTHHDSDDEEDGGDDDDDNNKIADDDFFNIKYKRLNQAIIDEQHNLQSLLHSASGVELAPDWIGMIQEKYMTRSDNNNNNNNNNPVDEKDLRNNEPQIDL